ncbi:hypothetical protein CERZMDRAFT_88981 [Cercospora zeae-maydis SCOH1-5]|uniref:Uncharacterized protein n=1 Tax=Cercospora zeae-maydis SCOH1-5 TaxID=717836 RepID=A0A6A6F144_9PEZI|nr:hypothetical protein CERZMDRAFT_88981 [Cercospora zeae-maydis SCOH1-5]
MQVPSPSLIATSLLFSLRPGFLAVLGPPAQRSSTSPQPETPFKMDDSAEQLHASSFVHDHGSAINDSRLGPFQEAEPSIESACYNMPSPIYLQNDKTLRDLSGKWVMSKSLSVGIPKALEIQGDHSPSPTHHTKSLTMRSTPRLPVPNTQSPPHIPRPSHNNPIALSSPTPHPNGTPPTKNHLFCRLIAFASYAAAPGAE